MSKYSEVIDHNEEELELALEKKNWNFQVASGPKFSKIFYFQTLRATIGLNRVSRKIITRCELNQPKPS